MPGRFCEVAHDKVTETAERVTSLFGAAGRASPLGPPMVRFTERLLLVYHRGADSAFRGSAAKRSEALQVVLITGAGGFCARHLARRLAAEGGARLVGFDLQTTAPAEVPLDDYVRVDLTDQAATAAAVERLRPTEVFHLAGRFAGDPVELYHANLMTGIHLLESLRQVVPSARILVVGSAAEYGCPLTDAPLTEDQPCRPRGPYGVSKYALTLAALDYARNYHLRIVVARPFNLVGPGIPVSLVVGAVLGRLKAALAAPGEAVISLGNLDTKRDFVPVEDVVGAYVRLVRSEYWGEVFNLCSSQAQTVRSVVERLIAFGPRPVQVHIDPRLVRADDPPQVIGSCQKASQCIGFQPPASIDGALRSAWRYALGEGGERLPGRSPLDQAIDHPTHA